MWGNVCRHTDGDTGATIDEKVRERSGEHRRLGSRFVIVRHEIDGVLVHVRHQGSAEMSHAGFGVTQGRGRITFDGSEIALTINEGLAHRPTLSHMDKGWVN